MMCQVLTTNINQLRVVIAYRGGREEEGRENDDPVENIGDYLSYLEKKTSHDMVLKCKLNF